MGIKPLLHQKIEDLFVGWLEFVAHKILHLRIFLVTTSSIVGKDLKLTPKISPSLFLIQYSHSGISLRFDGKKVSPVRKSEWMIISLHSHGVVLTVRQLLLVSPTALNRVLSE